MTQRLCHLVLLCGCDAHCVVHICVASDWPGYALCCLYTTTTPVLSSKMSKLLGPLEQGESPRFALDTRAGPFTFSLRQVCSFHRRPVCLYCLRVERRAHRGPQPLQLAVCNHAPPHEGLRFLICSRAAADPQCNNWVSLLPFKGKLIYFPFLLSDLLYILLHS